jgi:hypothetical protein
VQIASAFLYFATKPRTGLTNLLMGVVCTLIPAVGGILLLGYRAEVADDLVRDPARKDYPDFQFERFLQYLQRGVWPFLTQLLLVVFVVIPLALVSLGLGYLVHEALVESIPIAALAGILVWGTGLVCVQVILWPMEYHAQVTKSFSPLAELRFALGFLKRIGFSTVTTIVLFNFLTVLLNLAGLLCLFIGVYPAAVIQSMAEQHLIIQLYSLYLDEGGSPIIMPEQGASTLEMSGFDEDQEK